MVTAVYELTMLTLQWVRGQAPAGAPAGLNLRLCFCTSASPPMLPSDAAAEQLVISNDSQVGTSQQIGDAHEREDDCENIGSRALKWFVTLSSEVSQPFKCFKTR
jgi:hypothetical protein